MDIRERAPLLKGHAQMRESEDTMSIETHINRIERRLDDGKMDVIYVITREGHPPRKAWINGETFPRQDGETVEELADRAVVEYRLRCQPRENVSVLIMDCRR
jgi:hypothetical protein